MIQDAVVDLFIEMAGCFRVAGSIPVRDITGSGGYINV